MIRYFENSVENMRDIGGYKNNFGKKIKTGKLIRSNFPKNLTKFDLKSIKQMGINTIIDLRTDVEVQNNNSIFEDDKDFKVYHIGLVGRLIPKTFEMVPQSYMLMLEEKKEIRQVFEILGNNNKVIYFCSAGKDRTGVVTALILMLLDVSKETIIKDYVATADFMKKFLKEYAGTDTELLKLITPKKFYIKTFLKEFEKKYKNIHEYLKIIGVNDTIIQKIKGEYLEELEIDN